MYVNYFQFKEFISTSTQLDNSVLTDSHLSNLSTLWNTLNFLREELGAPIYINSAYRTPAVNRAVNGAKRSLHMQGRAADIRCESALMPKLWSIIQQYDQEYGLSEKINYETFYHIAL